MAKRRRLSALGMVGDEDDITATSPAPQRIPPVARIAADAAAQAALDDLADEMRQARDNGRMVVELPLDAIDAGHLLRDRLHLDDDDMTSLKASIADRGQQTPIEVVALADGRFGLISGARRLAALRALDDQPGEVRFDRVKALIRPAGTAPEAYLAMVEENEIRADLSFYERGRLAHEAARIGVFASPAEAVKALFVHAAPSKRSKILNFVALHEALGSVLHFPEAIPEKLGLALVKEIQNRPSLRKKLAADLRATAAETAVAERVVLERALKPAVPQTRNGGADQDKDVQAGVQITSRPGRIVLSGQGVTEDLLRDLTDWLMMRA